MPGTASSRKSKKEDNSGQEKRQEAKSSGPGCTHRYHSPRLSLHLQTWAGGLHDIQRDVGLSSASLADYHVQKLLRMKMIREEEGQDGVVGFAAEEAVFEAMVRIRRTVIPLRAIASAFFVVALVLLLSTLRPNYIDSTYVFSLVITGVALSISVYETLEGFSTQGI